MYSLREKNTKVTECGWLHKIGREVKKTAVVRVNMIKIYYKDEENYQIETHYFKNHI
jgi:hypothetical protein